MQFYFTVIELYVPEFEARKSFQILITSIYASFLVLESVIIYLIIFATYLQKA